MIGFSVTSIARDTAILLTKAVKSKYPDVFIVWGGIDVTTSPDVAVKYPDAVCIGEGYTILDLLHNLETGKSVNKIKNLWIKKGNEIIRNNLRPLVQDLNSLPAPDFSFENKFSINEDELITNDTSINNEPGIYTIMTSMGCPFSCSYCCNNYLRNLYKGQKYLRRKSVELVIEELKEAKKNYVIRYVDFYDEVFTFDKEWIKKFARLYKKEIKIPFWCNVSPFFVDEEVLMMLKDCGLDSVTMGIQSGSEKILFEKYNRKTPVSEIKNVL